MGKLLFGLGVIVGIASTAVVVALIINNIIPWEEVCFVVSSAQGVLETGEILISQLQEWLTKAEGFLTTSTPEQTAEARTGLGGLLDRAGDIVGDATRTFVDIVTAPLRELISVTNTVLSDLQASVNEARQVLATVDLSRCE